MLLIGEPCRFNDGTYSGYRLVDKHTYETRCPLCEFRTNAPGDLCSAFRGYITRAFGVKNKAEEVGSHFSSNAGVLKIRDSADFDVGHSNAAELTANEFLHLDSDVFCRYQRFPHQHRVDVHRRKTRHVLRRMDPAFCDDGDATRNLRAQTGGGV